MELQSNRKSQKSKIEHPSATLLVTAVEREAEGVRRVFSDTVENRCGGWMLTRGQLFGHPVALLLTGVGMVRVSVALSAVLSHARFSRVLQFGVGGAYPSSGLALGTLVLANSECDPQSGIETPGGFRDLTGLGFPLGERFPNSLPIDNAFCQAIAGVLPGAIRAGMATVATCSGTDSAARRMERLSGAKVEVMEGLPAAWISSCLQIPFAELRTISNTTGDRPNQQWDLNRACDILAAAIHKFFRSIPGV